MAHGLAVGCLRVDDPASGEAADHASDAHGPQVRIDPNLDLSALHLSRTGLIIARAAQKYGIVVRDTSGCVTFWKVVASNSSSV